MIFRSFFRLLTVLSLYVGTCCAQTFPGLQPLGTLLSKGADVINVGNNNVFIDIPILSKTGRGAPFQYDISLNSSIWFPVPQGNSQTWIPMSFDGSALGWQGLAPQSSQGINYTKTVGTESCGSAGETFTLYVYTAVSYRASRGSLHVLEGPPIEYAVGSNIGPCRNGPLNSTSSSLKTVDGSGYSVTMTLQGSGVNTSVAFQLEDAKGNTSIPPSTVSNGSYTGPLTISDANGNEITENGGIYTDTTGSNVLSVSYSAATTQPVNQHGGTTTVPAMTILTYNLPGNGTASFTATYSSYSVATNFQCSGIGEYGPVTTDLVSQITAPDGSIYKFTYENTPSQSGSVTGRIASVTLPTGGVISYLYSGGNNGINCGDGSTPTLTRISGDGTETFARANSNAPSPNTTVTDEKNNQSVYTFAITGQPPFEYLETDRKLYQGSVGGTPLSETATCYVGSGSGSCSTASFFLPITEIDKTSSFNGLAPLLTKTTYDSAGVAVTGMAEYSGSTLLANATNSYTIAGSLYELNSTAVTDGSGSPVAYTAYKYDESSPIATSNIPQHGPASTVRGNLTSTLTSIDGTSNLAAANVLKSSTVYYDTGSKLSTTLPTGVTTYGYDSTQTFVQTVTMPTPASGVGLSTSATYDVPSGALSTFTGLNPNQTTTYSQYDAYLRPTSISYPDGGSQSTSQNPNRSGVLNTMSSSTSSDTENLYDSYGRLSRVAILNGQSSSPWYQVDYCYDASGQLQFQSAKYQSTGLNVAEQCSGNGVSNQYDALGRTTQQSSSDGYTVNYTYNGRAVMSSDSNGVSQITQYDVLGRVSGICEISANSNMPNSGTPISCGMDIAGMGFVTSYQYDLANHRMTIVQGQQQRIFQTDAIGRTIFTQEPERGQTTYSYAYNSTGLLATRTRPLPNCPSVALANYPTPSQCQQSSPQSISQTQYDSAGRVVNITYGDGGVTPNKSYLYDAALSSQGWSSMPSNTVGQLAQMTSGSGSSLTRTQFSYDLMGRPVTTWQCAPSICGGNNQNSRPAVSINYDLAGNIVSEADVASGTISYGRSPAGEVTSINTNYQDQNNPSNVVSSIVNGPTGPTSYTLSNGLTATMVYDSLGRQYGKWICSGVSQQPGCSGGTQVHGTSVYMRGPQAFFNCDTVSNYCQANGYDEFNRLSSTNASTAVSYTYDRYGNRWGQTITSGAGPSPSYSFDGTTNRNTSFVYDGAGNVLSDALHTYTYDAEGNVLSVDGGSTATYVYDALNRRVVAPLTNGDGLYGTAEEEMYDPYGRLTSSWIVSNNLVNHGRIYWDGQQIAFRAFNGATYFDHKDILGTERIRTGPHGVVGMTTTSLPFGDNMLQTSPDNDQWAIMDTTNFGLLDTDQESGTEHAQFRQYSTTAGIWMSPDPYDGSYDQGNPQSFNRYAYVLNNPLSLVDPSGQAFAYGPPMCVTVTVYASPDPNATPITMTTCRVTETSVPDPSFPSTTNGVSFGGFGSSGSAAIGIPPAPSNGRNCSVGSASAGQYVAATAQVAALTAQFASGLGPTNQTFGPNTATSAVMAQSAAVTEVLGAYMFTGQTSGLYTFGGSGAYVNGGNPVAQFIGSFRYSLSGGILTLTNTTSLRSLTYDHGPQYQRGSFPTPGGNIHQTIQIGVVCH